MSDGIIIRSVPAVTVRPGSQMVNVTAEPKELFIRQFMLALGRTGRAILASEQPLSIGSAHRLYGAVIKILRVATRDEYLAQAEKIGNANPKSAHFPHFFEVTTD